MAEVEAVQSLAELEANLAEYRDQHEQVRRQHTAGVNSLPVRVAGHSRSRGR
jgi:hypothetical protein